MAFSQEKTLSKHFWLHFCSLKVPIRFTKQVLQEEELNLVSYDRSWRRCGATALRCARVCVPACVCTSVCKCECSVRLCAHVRVVCVLGCVCTCVHVCTCGCGGMCLCAHMSTGAHTCIRVCSSMGVYTSVSTCTQGVRVTLLSAHVFPAPPCLQSCPQCGCDWPDSQAGGSGSSRLPSLKWPEDCVFLGPQDKRWHGSVW